MIYLVKDKNYKNLGYLIENKFHSISECNCIFKDLKYVGVLYGVLYKTKVKISNKYYKISLFNYNELLQLKSNYLPILLITCSYRDVLNNTKSSFWQIGKNNKYYIYMNEKLEILGYLATDVDIYTSDDINVNMLEIVKRGEGNGRRLIEYLIKNNKTLKGLSTEQGKIFWKKLGAEFIDASNYFKL